MSTSSFLIICSIFTLSLATYHNTKNQLTVLYDSSAQDGSFQTQLFKGIFIGLSDFDSENTLQPVFIDISHTEISKIADHIIQNKTETVISLLSSNQLNVFSELITKKSVVQTLNIFTPRGLLENELYYNGIKIKSLQMSHEARITAILNRVTNVGTHILIPVLDDSNQLPLLKEYQKVSSKIAPNLRFASPVLLNSTQILNSKFLHSKNNPGFSQGILMLSRAGIPKNFIHEQTFCWFSHYSAYEWNEGDINNLLGLYTVQFIGSGKWDNPKRRKLLRKFNDVTGPTPSILSMVLAYDTAMVAVAHLRGTLTQNEVSNPLMGLSGEIRFNAKGFRSDGVFFGISNLPDVSNSTALLLQPSTWVLEDLIYLRQEEDVEIGEYQVATSSVLAQEELLELATKAKGYRKCEDIEMEVLTHDPFNQIDYRYHFTPNTLPLHLIIPNQHGYGITFRCQKKNSLSMTTLQLACTPSNGRSIGEPVHCFRSRIRNKRAPYYSTYKTKQSKTKLDPRYISSHYSRISNNSPRDDSSYLNYYQPTPSDVYYNSYYSYNPYDSSTPSTLTTRLDVPINEDPTTHAPTVGGVAKLPELRQILKAAKPFVASCIGSTTGCAVCVLVLGRLPLGAVPAACTGPCFVGTFGTCGSLLGRVFSETTIVCTELFRQGLLDVETFIADSEFGSKIAAESPTTLLGYQVLATPLVEKMKESESFTRVVAYFALPWAQHMKYLMGNSDEFSWKGYIIHTFGFGVCSVFGTLLNTFTTTSIESLGYSLGAFLVGTTLIFRRFTK